MESQSFVFLKAQWDIPEPLSNLQLFAPQPRINEISLSAVNRIHLTEPDQVGFSMASRKMNFPVHPDNLQNFFQLLTVFFKSLPKPICLVAHNGNNFDFPLLKCEWGRMISECEENVSDIVATFNNVYCVDSAEGFLKLFSPSPPVPSLADVNKASKHLFCKQDAENVEPNASSLVTCEWDVSDFDRELSLISQIASELYDEKNFNRNELESDVQDEYNLNRLSSVSGRTGKTGCEGEPSWKNIRKEVITSNEKTPLRGKNINGNSQQVIRQRAVDLSLRAVYLRVFNEPLLLTHTASIEEEVKALSEIVAHLGIPILEIFDRIKVLFPSKVFT